MKIILNYKDSKVEATRIDSDNPVIEESMSIPFRKYYQRIKTAFEIGMQQLSKEYPTRLDSKIIMELRLK